MTVIEMLNLAKSGYKPNEIAELMKLEKEATAEVTEDAPETDAENTEVSTDESVAEVVTETVTVVENEQSDMDYKKLYEQTLDTLKAVQSANINRDSSNTDTRSLNDIAIDIFRRI